VREILLIIARVAVAAVLVVAPARSPKVLLRDDFGTRPAGLLTNEYAYRHPDAPGVHKDRVWEMTSGSLFVRKGRGYTGVPDHISPNATSSNGTNSAVFRCRSRRTDFGDVAVEFDLLNVALYDHTGVPPSAYDGVHVWLRYQAENNLYAVTINRRDDRVVIKKKIPGGPSNDGTYYTLAEAPSRVAPRVWQHVRTTVHNNPNRSVTITLWIDGRLRVTATDTGVNGGPAILKQGRTGVRGDNCEFYFDNVHVTAL
jgi:hypothetical protein